MVKRAAPITGPEPTLPRLQELIQEYRVSNSVDGKSAKTVRWYTDLLTLFLTSLDSNGLSCDLSAFNISTAHNYVPIDVTIDGKDQLALAQSWAQCLYGVGLLAIPYLGGGESLLETNHRSLADDLPLQNVVGRANYSGGGSA